MDKKFVVSSDSHIVEPPELFVDRMDVGKYGDRIPHLVNEADNDFWYSDHKRMGVLGSFGPPPACASSVRETSNGREEWRTSSSVVTTPMPTCRTWR